jgi:hypothetical protein
MLLPIFDECAHGGVYCRINQRFFRQISYDCSLNS